MPTRKKVVENFKVNVHSHGHGSGSAVYGLGFLGALIYYLSTATSITAGLIGIVKAILWPAFLVFSLMKYLGM